MTEPTPTMPPVFDHGPLPAGVRAGAGTVITGKDAFRRFRATATDSLVVGDHSTLHGCHFAVGVGGRLVIGDWCHFSGAILLSELLVRIGDYVALGLNVTIADTDFHPVAPAERVADAIALSPLGQGRPRPEIVKKPVIIEDNVWVGPNATILKGVRIGAGAFVEAGSMVTKDVAPGARVMGNPATVIGSV